MFDESLEVGSLFLSELERSVEFKAHEFVDFFASGALGLAQGFFVTLSGVFFLVKDSGSLESISGLVFQQVLVGVINQTETAGASSTKHSSEAKQHNICLKTVLL